jgi:hypothetical protein
VFPFKKLEQRTKIKSRESRRKENSKDENRNQRRETGRRKLMEPKVGSL